MPTLTPDALATLQLRYMKYDVLKNKWIGVHAYYFKFAFLICLLGGWVPGDIITETDFLSLFSNRLSEYCQKFFDLDLTRGANVVPSPDALVFFRFTLIMCMLFIFIINFSIKYMNFKAKVNYYWADNYNKDSIRCLLILFFFPILLFFYFKLLMGEVYRPSGPRSGVMYFQTTRAFFGAGFLFFFSGFVGGILS